MRIHPRKRPNHASTPRRTAISQTFLPLSGFCSCRTKPYRAPPHSCALSFWCFRLPVKLDRENHRRVCFSERRCWNCAAGGFAGEALVQCPVPRPLFASLADYWERLGTDRLQPLRPSESANTSSSAYFPRRFVTRFFFFFFF